MSAINDQRVNTALAVKAAARRTRDPAGNDRTRDRQVVAPPPRTAAARRVRRFFERREETQCSTPRGVFPIT